MNYRIIEGDCLEALPSIETASVDAVITDPPYPEIDRDYGRLTEAAWWDLMMGVCSEVRRILKPSGSAVFILQPNSAKVGSMRGWLWRFMYWVTTDWNMVQDAYWWNYKALPVGGAITAGLMRGSIKPCIWAGSNNCYRNQVLVLWEETHASLVRRSKMETHTEESISGRKVNRSTMGRAANMRGGVTPYNCLPVPGDGISGAYGHGAGTPLKLADWWVRYIVPAGGVVLDPFNGAGTMGIAAIQNGASYIGIEKMPKYVEASHTRLAKVQPALVTI